MHPAILIRVNTTVEKSSIAFGKSELIMNQVFLASIFYTASTTNKSMTTTAATTPNTMVTSTTTKSTTATITTTKTTYGQLTIEEAKEKYGIKEIRNRPLLNGKCFCYIPTI